MTVSQKIGPIFYIQFDESVTDYENRCLSIRCPSVDRTLHNPGAKGLYLGLRPDMDEHTAKGMLDTQLQGEEDGITRDPDTKKLYRMVDQEEIRSKYGREWVQVSRSVEQYIASK